MNFRSFFSEHKWACLLLIAAVVFCILLFTIGFWRTVLVIIIGGAAVFLGSLADKGGWRAVKEFFGNLFGKKA